MKTLIKTAVAVMFIASFFMVATSHAAPNKFKPRAFRMKQWRPNKVGQSFKVRTRSLTSTTRRAFRVSPSTKRTVNSSTRNRYAQTARIRSFKHTTITLRNRDNRLKRNEAGRKSGFHQSQFNGLKVQTRFISRRPAQQDRF